MNVKMNAFLFLCLFCLYSYAHGSPLFDRRLSWSKNFLKSTRDNPKPSTGTSWSKNFLKSTRDNPKPSTGTSWSKNFLASTKPASTNWLSNSKGSSFSSFKPFTPLSTTKNAWSYKPPSLTTTKNWLGNYKPYLSTFKGTPRTRNSYAYLPKTSYASFARNSVDSIGPSFDAITEPNAKCANIMTGWAQCFFKWSKPGLRQQPSERVGAWAVDV